MKKFSKRIVALLLTIVMLLPTGIFGVVSNAANIPSDAVKYNGHYYYLFSDVISWAEAKSACERMGGHLATITSPEENRCIANMITQSPSTYWIGAKKNTLLKKWQWITGEEWIYSNWAAGEPFLDSATVARIDGDCDVAKNGDHFVFHRGEWDACLHTNATSHTVKLSGYICEWESTVQFPDGYDFKRDSYHFRNIVDTVSKDIYQDVFGDKKGQIVYKKYEEGKSAHGLCYGMAATTGSLLLDIPYVSSFLRLIGPCQTIRDINEGTKCLELDMITAKTFIKYGFATQFSKQAQWGKQGLISNVEDIYNAVYDYVHNDGAPVIISLKEFNYKYDDKNDKFVWEQSVGHAVLAIGLSGSDGIIVNDSNYPNSQKIIELKKDSNGNFTNEWDYKKGYSWAYGDNSFNESAGRTGTIGYRTSVVLPYLVKHAHAQLDYEDTTAEEDEASEATCEFDAIDTEYNLLYLSSDEITMSCADDNLTKIASPIYGTDSVVSDDVNMYWVENDKTITFSNLIDETNEIEFTDNNIGIKAILSQDSEIEITADDSEDNSAIISSQKDDRVEVTFSELNDDKDIIYVTIDGTVSDKKVTATQTETGLVVDGISDGTVTLSKDEQVVETQTINNAVSDIEIIYDKNDENKDIELDYEHKHSYTAETTDANCENEGKTVYTCSCGDTYTETIAPLGHTDANHDGVCDNCGEDFTKTCNCMCHSNSKLVKFIYKVMRFFWRLFGIEERHYCSCGKAHW